MKGRADWAWEIWSKGDEIGNRALGVWREDDYYVGAFTDKGEAKRHMRRLMRSHPGVRYYLKRRRVAARQKWLPGNAMRRRRRASASWNARQDWDRDRRRLRRRSRR